MTGRAQAFVLALLFLFVLGLSALSFLIVKLLRKQIGRWAYLAAAGPFLAAGLWIGGRTYQSMPNHGGPITDSAKDLARYVNSQYYGYWGMAFFHKRLYVGTNAG